MEIISPVRARAQAENDLMAIEQDRRRNALMDMQARRQDQAMQFEQQRFSASQEASEREREAAAEAQHIGWIKNAIGLARQNPQVIPALVGEAKQRGLLAAEVQTLTPEDIETLALHFGVAPAAQAPQMQVSEGPFGSRIVQQGGRFQVVEPPKPAAGATGAAPKFRPAAPEEVAAAGLPEGTSAQIGADGEMSVLRAPSAADVRNQQQAKRFVPRVDALDRRVGRVEQAVKAFSGDRFVNTGPMDQAVTRFMPKGQELEQAVNQAQTELQALTRIPGIGSQSDWEGRLQLLAWPSVGFDPAVNQRAIAEIKAFVRDIQASVKEAAGLQAPKSSGASGSFGEPAKQVRQRYDANGKPVK